MEETWKCQKCGEVKLRTEDNYRRYGGKQYPNGPGPWRKVCRACDSRTSTRWKKGHPEQVRATKRTPVNMEKARRDSRVRRAADPEKARLRGRSTAMKCMYGITLDDYRRMFAEQRGACCLCGVAGINYVDTPAGRGGVRHGQLVIDHQHSTGKVRSLLCVRCNNGLGAFEDCSALLRRAAEYLDTRNEVTSAS